MDDLLENLFEMSEPASLRRLPDAALAFGGGGAARFMIHGALASSAGRLCRRAFCKEGTHVGQRASCLVVVSADACMEV
jgi:hypothetical protein